MANLFDITTPTTNVILDADRKGEASFVVTNTSGAPIRGRALLEAADQSVLAWLKPVGEVEFLYAAGESHQFTIKIEVPASVASGKYTFRMDALDVEHTDEGLVIGPEVIFSVPEPLPLPAPVPWWKKFPWWIVAVAAGVILLVVILIVLLLPRSTVPDVTKKTVNVARPTITAAGLEPGEAFFIQSTDVPKNLIIRSDPAAGQKVRKGTVVDLIVSSGTRVIIPGVTRLSESDAVKKLQQACKPSPCLNVVVQRQRNKARIGTVLGTVPDAGTEVDPGDTVILLVSSGPFGSP
jgi:serine/threonine-protein kinase